GGVDGHPARLLVEDDGSGAAGEAAAYSKLVGQKVTGLIGPVDLVASEAAIVSSATRQIPLVSPAGVDQVPTRPNVFLAAPSASRSTQRMLAYARASSLLTVAVAHPTGDPFADVGAAAVRDQASRSGIRVVLDQPFDPGT